MQDDVEQKQRYLYREIIEAGYNGQEFQEFLENKNYNAQNLAEWKLNDLKKVVTEFKTLKNTTSNKITQQPSNIPSTPTLLNSTSNKQTIGTLPPKLNTSQSQKKMNMVSNTTTNTLQNKPSEVSPNKQQNSYTQVIKCQKHIKSSLMQLSGDGLQIEIVKYEKRQGGLFQKNYFVYLISTPALKTVVERRYSDFQWLRETLKTLHPGLPIPPITKKGKIRRSDDKHAWKRMLLLEIFLNKMMTIPDIVADQLFQSFIKTTQYKEFEKIKSVFKKNQELPFYNIKKTNGELILTTDPKVNNYLSKTQKYYKTVQPDIKKIYKDFKGVATMLENAANLLNGISLTAKDLNVKLNNYFLQGQMVFNNVNMFSILELTMAKLSSLISDQSKVFRKDLYAGVKYQSFMMLNYIDCIGDLATMQQQYVEALQILQKKKDRLYDEGNMAKWNLTEKFINKPPKDEVYHLMLPKETKEVNKIKEKYALWNNEIKQQVLRNNLNNNKFMSKMLKTTTKSFSKISSEMMMLWADAQLRVQNMKEVIINEQK